MATMTVEHLAVGAFGITGGHASAAQLVEPSGGQPPVFICVVQIWANEIRALGLGAKAVAIEVVMKASFNAGEPVRLKAIGHTVA